MSSLDGPADSTPAPPPILNPSGGANQIRVRAYNERLVLSLVRRLRRAVESGDRPTQRAVGTDGLRHHAGAGEGRAAFARRARARARGAAFHSDAAQSGCGAIPSASRSAGEVPTSC